MRPGNRCSRPGVEALALLLLASCFSPVGSVASATDSDASTSQTPTGPLGTTAGATTDTGEATQSSSADASTAAALTESTTTTGSSTTTTTATSATSTAGPEVCGDGVVQADEACDEGAANGDAQPCRSDCTLATCGDGVTCSGCAAPETCDDGNAIDDDACDLDCQQTNCGNRALEGTEECDDGNQIAGDGCSARCLVEQQFMFLASVKVPANFTGLAAADQLCTVLGAQNFNLRRKFVAWLSDSNTSAASRIGTSQFAYKLPMGGLIASNTADLLDGSIATPILETEDGSTLPVSPGCDGVSGVWTGTIAMGQNVSDTCGDWTTTQGQGLTGNFGVSNSGWSQACNFDCTASMRIYCVETAL